jgi:putative tryptophan/tyrosine transport system substrate-binding protein
MSAFDPKRTSPHPSNIVIRPVIISKLGVRMRRREFITLVGVAAAVWPGMAQAQQPERLRRIGVLMAHPETDPEFRAYVTAFREGLENFGWQEGRTAQIKFRWGALDDAEVRQQSAKEIIAWQPDVIITQNTPPTASMLQLTRSIPVVFVVVADPVGSGFVESLARPGGNATGFTVMEPTSSGKWLQLLKEIAPRIQRAAVLYNPETSPYANIYLNPIKAAAASAGLEAIAAPVHSATELESVVAEQARTPNTGLIVIPDGFINVHRLEMVSLADRHQVPVVYPWRFFPDIGGLASYGIEQRDLFRGAAVYVDRILRGAKPGELPVQAPVKYELLINLKAAKALGLDVSLQLQQRADEVIE